MTSARKIYDYPGTFKFYKGEELAGVQLAYETWGELSAQRDNAILLFTGLSPTAHACSSAEDPSNGWWEGMIGPGKPIDTDRFFVICMNTLGSCHGTTGPASIDPATGKPFGVTFPELWIEDIATAAHSLVEKFEIDRLYAAIGPSLGGMAAQAYAAMYPGRYARLALLTTGPHTLPFAIALRSVQRDSIVSDPAWNDGDYPLGKGPIIGMRRARKVGMISYRSAAEWEQRFGRDRVPAERKNNKPFSTGFEIESYIHAHGDKFTGEFDPNCYLYLSRALDTFDLAEHGGSLAKAFARFDADKHLLIGVHSDLLYPMHQMREMKGYLAAAGRNVELVELDSLQGHDSFLIDMEGFGAPLRKMLAD